MTSPLLTFLSELETEELQILCREDDTFINGKLAPNSYELHTLLLNLPFSRWEKRGPDSVVTTSLSEVKDLLIDPELYADRWQLYQYVLRRTKENPDTHLLRIELPDYVHRAMRRGRTPIHAPIIDGEYATETPRRWWYLLDLIPFSMWQREEHGYGEHYDQCCHYFVNITVSELLALIDQITPRSPIQQLRDFINGLDTENLTITCQPTQILINGLLPTQSSTLHEMVQGWRREGQTIRLTTEAALHRLDDLESDEDPSPTADYPIGQRGQ